MARLILLVVLCSSFNSAHARCFEQTGSKAKTDQQRCVSFESPRLPSGKSFTTPVGKGLELRLQAAQRGTWDIRLGPTGTLSDYIWVVSPPFQTAPHLTIGAGYHLTAAESATLSPRRLRFVTTPEEYEDALAYVERARSDPAANITAKDIEEKGTASLEVWITEFGLSPSGDSLSWISVKGRACRRQ